MKNYECKIKGKVTIRECASCFEKSDLFQSRVLCQDENLITGAKNDC